MRENILAGDKIALTPTLGNRSRRCSTSCIHAVVSRRERGFVPMIILIHITV